MAKKVKADKADATAASPDTSVIPVESHPWPPFIPKGARVVLMGTFPPTESRWAMKFFYPNRTNDFWRIMSLIFLGDPEACYDREARAFRVDELKQLLTDHHIALAATTTKVRRLKGNASDKDLEIVEMVDLPALLAQIPDCRVIATTGEKAASVIAELTGTPLPKIGQPLPYTDRISIWRLPSTSRAYPLPLPQKAEYYAAMFRSAGLL